MKTIAKRPLALPILMFTLLLLLTAMNFTDEHRPEIHCKHFVFGYPYGTPASNDLIIRDNYAMSNNDDTKFADWLAYRLNLEMASGESKSRNWNADPYLSADETLEEADYKGANAELKTDRGHQAPLGSFDGTETWAEVNYLSNITPQKSHLNQGTWKALEDKVRKMLSEYETVYVMTGPLYEKEMEPLPKCDEEHKVPSGYWKIVCVLSEDNKIDLAAFIFDQETPRKSKIKTHAVTVNEVETRSGLDFFWEMPDDDEETLEEEINETWLDKHFSQD